MDLGKYKNSSSQQSWSYQTLVAIIQDQLIAAGVIKADAPVIVPEISEAPMDGQRYARQNAGWSVLDALTDWQSCTFPAGCSGPLYARGLGDPQKGVGMVEVIGQASATTAWDASYSFILAYMPPGLVPGADRFALVPSSDTADTPDSISCAWFKSTGEIAVAFIYEKGPNPLIAWFNAVSIQI